MINVTEMPPHRQDDAKEYLDKNNKDILDLWDWCNENFGQVEFYYSENIDENTNT